MTRGPRHLNKLTFGDQSPISATGQMNETARAVERCAQTGTWTDDRYTARETEVRIGCATMKDYHSL